MYNQKGFNTPFFNIMNLILKEEPVIHDNNISSVITDFTKKEKKVIIIDADYIPFNASYSGKDEFGEKNPEVTLEEAIAKVDDMILRIYLEIEEYFEIDSLYLCVRGKNNFRKQIYPPYKANRKEKPALINELTDYLVEHHKAIPSPYGEADDLVFSISETINHEGIVVSPDKDLLQIPSIIYNPSKNTWVRIDEETARYNLAIQVLMGDNSDGVNLFYRTGIKTAEKYLQKGMTNYQYIKSILSYIKKYDEYKDRLRMSYKLVKLHNVVWGSEN